MCTQPISIISRAKRFVDFHHKLFQTVPCGKCDSCRERITDDWQLRCYAEMLNTLRYGGRTIFLTNTYKPSCRPYHIDNDIDEYGNPYSYKIPCFSKRDVIRFVRSFSRHLYRNFFKDSVEKYKGIKYFIASEYGKDPNGERCPHYHILLHIPSCSATNIELENLARRCWSVALPKNHPLRGKMIPHKDLKGNYILDKTGNIKLFKKVRQSLGFVLVSEKGLVVDSSYACSYVGKYCCKDLDFYENPVVKKYLDPLHPNYEIHKERIKEKLPRHWQSHYYGSSMLDVLDLDFDDAMLNGFHLTSNPDKSYSLPRYVVDKVMYYTDDSGRRFLTEHGRKYFANTFDRRVSAESFKYSMLFSSLTLKNLTQEQLNSIRYYNGSSFFYRPIDLSIYLQKLLNGRNHELALYHQVWQNRTCCEPYVFTCVDGYNIEQFRKVSRELYFDDINVTPDDYPVVEFTDNLDFITYSAVIPDTLEFDKYKLSRFNRCERFKYFDYLIETATYIQSCLNINTLSANLKKRKERELSKYILKHSNKSPL